MPLTTIYITRHGFRLNWTVDVNTGTYSATHNSPTGIASDPPLAAHGVTQSQQLSTHLQSLSHPTTSPPISRIYSSPFYRCLQTLQPFVESRPPKERVVRGENGLGEWYGRARFTHPSPAPAETLGKLFSFYDTGFEPSIVPSQRGETVEELHDRCAYALARILAEEDRLDAAAAAADGEREGGERAILICTHAASMIAIGRALTGRMPEDVCEDDFRTFTCGVSTFKRRTGGGVEGRDGEAGELERWKPGMPVPVLDWKDGKGVGGGWDCTVNGDCSFLEDGEERGWHFSGDEAFDDQGGIIERTGYKL